MLDGESRKFMLGDLKASRYEKRRWWIALFRRILDGNMRAIQNASRMNAELRNAWQKRERIADARSLD